MNRVCWTYFLCENVISLARHDLLSSKEFKIYLTKSKVILMKQFSLFLNTYKEKETESLE